MNEDSERNEMHRYGQMTAGSYCYIGPQGIVHGTFVRFDIEEKKTNRKFLSGIDHDHECCSEEIRKQ